MYVFGPRIRQLREQQKMSQEQLGRLVDRSKSVISSYENNIKIPPLDILRQLALIFSVSLDYLVGIDKTEMISVEGLSQQQKKLLQTIVFEMKDKSHGADGLTVRQQEILNGLMMEFARRESV